MIRTWLLHLEDGVRLEVRTPRLKTTDIETEDGTDVIAELSEETKIAIDERNRKLFLVQQQELRLELPKPDNKEKD